MDSLVNLLTGELGLCFKRRHLAQPGYSTRFSRCRLRSPLSGAWLHATNTQAPDLAQGGIVQHFCTAPQRFRRASGASF